MYEGQQIRGLGAISQREAVEMSRAVDAEYRRHADKPTDSMIGCAKRERGSLEFTMDRNMAAIDELNATVSELEERLQQVMLPEPPQPVSGTGTSAPMPVCSAAVGYLQNHGERINSIRRRVTGLIGRLDV